MSSAEFYGGGFEYTSQEILDASKEARKITNTLNGLPKTETKAVEVVTRRLQGQPGVNYKFIYAVADQLNPKLGLITVLPSPDEGKKACPTCTLLNDQASEKCDVCGTKLQPDTSSPSSSPAKPKAVLLHACVKEDGTVQVRLMHGKPEGTQKTFTANMIYGKLSQKEIKDHEFERRELKYFGTRKEVQFYVQIHTPDELAEMCMPLVKGGESRGRVFSLLTNKNGNFSWRESQKEHEFKEGDVAKLEQCLQDALTYLKKSSRK